LSLLIAQNPLTPVVRKNTIRPKRSRANTHDASRPAPSERVRLLVCPNDAGIARWRAVPPLQADREHPGPTPCAGAPRGNGSPTLSESIASAILITESTNPCTRVGSFQSPVRKSHWSFASTTPQASGAQRRFRVTHPYHPLSGCEFEVVTYRHNWGEDRVYFRDENGEAASLPASWTSLAAEDPFVAISAGRAHFRFEDLMRLVQLLRP
jgi:hypothetical protein